MKIWDFVLFVIIGRYPVLCPRSNLMSCLRSSPSGIDFFAGPHVYKHVCAWTIIHLFYASSITHQWVSLLCIMSSSKEVLADSQKQQSFSNWLGFGLVLGLFLWCHPMQKCLAWGSPQSSLREKKSPDHACLEQTLSIPLTFSDNLTTFIGAIKFNRVWPSAWRKFRAWIKQPHQDTMVSLIVVKVKKTFL